MLKCSGIHIKYLYIIHDVGSFGLFSDNDRSIMFTVYDATTNMHKVYNVEEINTNHPRNLNIFQN